MNILDNEKLIERLSAEYVLGTLRGGALRRFDGLLANSAVLRRAVAEWQDRLCPIAEFASAELPPPRVWSGIARKLNLPDTQRTSDRYAFWRGLREDLAFWRGLGMVSTALATILVGVLVTRQPESVAPGTSYVAMLTDDQAVPVALATGDPATRQVTIKLVNHQNIAADKSLELWAVPKDGMPRSLGLLASDGSITLPLPTDMTPQSIPLLAVSLEPKGGAPLPKKGPTGPVIYKGAWVKV
ncbi:anti-sigma factor [Actimicrobium antarcticum]|uniref:Anti-sigma factor n=1 Tax=Actimicrobium antarcticum TaxID=1051899 RepID=A0ABP7T9J8_9BURK